MVMMSEALRGYILDPKNTKELERKKMADEAYSAQSAKLAKLTSKNKAIHELNEKMEKLDAEHLDKAENELAEMVNQDRAKVLEFFSKTYLPIRSEQTQNFLNLKKLANEYSESLIKKIDQDKKEAAFATMIFILTGTIIGSGFIYYVSHKVNQSSTLLFSSIYKISDELTTTADGLSTRSHELSEATTQEASAIQQTASSLHQITSMVQRNTDNAEKSIELSSASREASYRGLSSVKSMIQAMDEINLTQTDIINSVDQGNKKISDIVGVISAIGEKTKVINDIVFQTKLLSFNASVEAARAGEQGKGFAVVAEEVGNLAAMSGKAAQEITTMLEDSIKRVSTIVEETKHNVEKIVYVGKDKISNGTAIAADCAHSLEDVVKKIEEVDRTIGEISIASKEQSQGITEINSAVSQLDTATQHNKLIANETFESSKLLADKSNNLRENVNNLVEIFRGKKS